jgi:two-component system alkaline phosphatase synthesis response regulator PhoP
MSNGNKASILLVEDEENLHEALKLNLELEGYEVTSAFRRKRRLKSCTGRIFRPDYSRYHVTGNRWHCCIESIRVQNIEVPVLILSAKKLKFLTGY